MRRRRRRLAAACFSRATFKNAGKGDLFVRFSDQGPATDPAVGSVTDQRSHHHVALVALALAEVRCGFFQPKNPAAAWALSITFPTDGAAV